MSVEEVRRVLSDPLFSEIQNIGFNGGEPTLRRDLELLVSSAIEVLPKLESVSLITNAIRPDRVIGAIEEIGRLCKNANKHLDVMVSLDGVGEVHDLVRGVPGNFKSAVKVIDYLISTPWVASRRLGCTIIAENAFGVEEVLDFSRRRGIYCRFRLGIPHQRLYTGTLREPFALGPEALFHVAAFLDTLIVEYEHSQGRRAFYRSLRDQLIYGKPRAAGCVWKNHGVTLGPRGELAFCAVASPNLGDAREISAGKIFWEQGDVLRNIVDTKCADCRHDYEGIGSRRLLVREWLGRASKKMPTRFKAVTLKSVDSCRTAIEWARVFDLGRIKVPASSRGARKSVLLCGWYGTETLGDRAILAGICRLISEEIGNVGVDVASLEPYITKETCRLLPELCVRSVINLPEALRKIASGDYWVVAVAGGPLMTPVREVVELCRLLNIARCSGSFTALLGCGLGPLALDGVRRFAIEKMVRDVDICILRDSASVALARSFGRKADLQTAVDPAFFWSALTSSFGRKKKDCKIVALALRDWHLSDYAADVPLSVAQDLKARFERELLCLIDTLGEFEGIEVVPVCMHTHSVGGDDRMFYRRLFANRPVLADLVPWRRRTPHQEVDQIRGADAVVAMRFHSCVFALAMRKPFLALDYTRGGKIEGLMNDTDNRSRLVNLEKFDGRQCARRLLAEITTGEMPDFPSIVARGENIYRDSFRHLKVNGFWKESSGANAI